MAACVRHSKTQSVRAGLPGRAPRCPDFVGSPPFPLTRRRPRWCPPLCLLQGPALALLLPDALPLDTVAGGSRIWSDLGLKVVLSMTLSLAVLPALLPTGLIATRHIWHIWWFLLVVDISLHEYVKATGCLFQIVGKYNIYEGVLFVLKNLFENKTQPVQRWMEKLYPKINTVSVQEHSATMFTKSWRDELWPKSFIPSHVVHRF